MTRRHPSVAAIGLFLAVVGLNLLLTAWAYLYLLLPWLAFGALVLFAWRAVRRHQFAAPGRPRVLRGQVINDQDDAELMRAELARLRDDNAKLRAKVRVLSDLVNGPEARP